MEKIHIIKKGKTGYEYGFVQSIVRGKGGKFDINPLARKNQPSLVIGLLFLVILVLLLVIFNQHLTIQDLNTEIVSPIAL